MGVSAVDNILQLGVPSAPLFMMLLYLLTRTHLTSVPAVFWGGQGEKGTITR